MKARQSITMNPSSLTEVFEMYPAHKELLRESPLKAGAEVKGRMSKLLFLKEFVYPALATKWFVLKAMEADD